MGLEEIDNYRTLTVQQFVLDRLFTHSLFKLNATYSGSTITIQNKL